MSEIQEFESATLEMRVANWRRYEKVRQGGRWNMFDPRAQRATGLSRDDYLDCLKNYTELRAIAALRARPLGTGQTP